ncbi:zinc transporter 1 [Nematolebias whitei]|uniref:zinc transporter 1 n=1 Tax=Nematolebias whitei TaxID=451745 RepID=UPI00189852CC|nr:zinc transporter 1 [Nematolebias whitei]
MRVHWCMLGVTVLLLLCEIIVSQLCKSLITMIDGFHTIFIVIHLTLLHPQTGNIIKPVTFSSLGAASPSPQPNLEAPTCTSHTLSSPAASPAAPRCGLSLPSSRIPAVGVFISALLLTSLCISYFLEIIGHMLEPHPVQLPLLPVVVAAVSLLCKMLLFVLNWDQLQDGRTESCDQLKPKVWVGEESEGREHTVQSKVGSAERRSLHGGALVFCNPGAPSTPTTACKNQQKQSEIRETQSRAADLNSESRNPADSQNASSSSVCPLSFIFVIQGLFTSLLALINSLLILIIVPQLQHGSGLHRVLVYLDPGFSLLAVTVLVATTAPQAYRYGLLLLQASPPHVPVSDLKRRIASVPGVQDVHELHIWQLTESLTMASVHVHCCPGFPARRCAELMSGVTKVLQSVGVSCCTVQPELTSLLGGAPSSPPLPVCGLSCGESCAARMCCSLLEEETRTCMRPAAGDTTDTLVIQNKFQ